MGCALRKLVVRGEVALLTLFIILRTVVVTTAMGVGIALPVLANTQPPLVSPPSVLKQATVAQSFQSLLYLPLYIAMDRGFFKHQGLAVTVVTAGSPSAALSAVLSGQAQFSVHGPEWTAIAASKEEKVDIISNLVNGAAVYMAATPDFKFDGIKSLKGQTIVTEQMPSTGTSLLLKLLKENDMEVGKDVMLIETPTETEGQVLLQKKAKIAVLYEPQLDQMLVQGMQLILSFPKLYEAYAFSAVTARMDVEADIAQRMVNGIQLALNFMQTHPKQTQQIACKEFPTVAPDVVQKAVQRMLDDNVYPKNVKITMSAYKTAMETQLVLDQENHLDNLPDYTSFVVSTYSDQALNLSQ